MKKNIYQAPALTVTAIKSRNHILSGSLQKVDNKTVTGTVRGGWTKEENRSTYNIWDDDWNK